jgi:hypothetical protein
VPGVRLVVLGLSERLVVAESGAALVEDGLGSDELAGALGADGVCEPPVIPSDCDPVCASPLWPSPSMPGVRAPLAEPGPLRSRSSVEPAGGSPGRRVEPAELPLPVPAPMAPVDGCMEDVPAPVELPPARPPLDDAPPLDAPPPDELPPAPLCACAGVKAVESSNAAERTDTTAADDVRNMGTSFDAGPTPL